MQQSILTVSLKDLATLESSASQTFGTGFELDEGLMGDDDRPMREQYRVIKKDLLFKVNF